MEGGNIVVFGIVLDLNGGFNFLSATRGVVTESSITESSMGFIPFRIRRGRREGKRVKAKGFQEIFEVLERITGSSNGSLELDLLASRERGKGGRRARALDWKRESGKVSSVAAAGLARDVGIVGRGRTHQN